VRLPFSVKRMPHDRFRRGRNVSHVDARVPDGVDHRWRRPVNRHLADAFRTKRSPWIRIFEQHDVDVGVSSVVGMM